MSFGIAESLIGNKRIIIKLFVSIKHTNILLFILTYWRQVSVVSPPGHPYKKF